MNLIRRSTYKTMPWKNGLGQTAEIARFPAGDGPYLWRLSLAEVHADGPFSLFPGFDRWLSVWRGAGLVLNGHPLHPLKPFLFSGDQSTNCQLLGQGPVTDIGLIFDRTQVNATMSIVENSVDLADLGPLTTHSIFDLESGDTLQVNGAAAQLNCAKSLLISVSSRPKD